MQLISNIVLLNIVHLLQAEYQHQKADVKQNVPFPVYSSFKQRSVDLQTSTVKVKKRHFVHISKKMLSITLLPGLDCAGFQKNLLGAVCTDILWLLHELGLMLGQSWR